MWIDSHAHLYDYPHEELVKIVNEASKEAVSIIVSTATSVKTTRDVISHCKNFNTVWGAGGVSPFDVLTQPENWQTQLSELLNHPKMVAVGEIGIDNSNPSYPELSRQIPFFESQLQMAIDLNLPAIIHSRDIEKTAIEICKSLGVKKAVFHCFTGDMECLRKLLDYGYYVSFSGIVTFKKAPLQEQVNFAPFDRILTETDTPYLAPEPFRGNKNKPSWIPVIGKKLAQIKNVAPEIIQSCVEQNFRSLFNI
ncbi:MAG: TatD family hydrolase [Fibrobacter sp.]|nr:TatD family hydrolase [Fibrobacter sp.]